METTSDLRLVELKKTKTAYIAKFIDCAGRSFVRFVSNELAQNYLWATIQPSNLEYPPMRPTNVLNEYVKATGEYICRVVAFIEWKMNKSGEKYATAWDFTVGAFRSFREDRILGSIKL